MTFDLEKARAADEVLPYPLDAKEIWVSGKGQMHINPPNAPSIFFTLSDLCEFRNIFHGQAAEIERLQGFETAARDLNNDLIRIAGERDELAARIQELEDALVEMVATNPCNIPTLCDVVHDELMCLALDGNCDFWKGCPQKNELRKAARKQLQAEGKIGPDDSKKISHLRPYEVVAADLAGMLAKSWQITEERKAAILHCKRMLTFLKEDDAPCYDVEKITKDESVLVAMLEEAKP